MRVGFTLMGSGGKGTGGYNYLLNLLSVLCRYQAKRVTPVLFLGSDVTNDEGAPFTEIPTLEIVRSHHLDHERKGRALLASLLTGADWATRELFARHGIELLFESAQFHGWRLPFPVLAWITDFQHRLLPHMFTWAGYWKRELGLRTQMAAGRMIMLSSEDARGACEHFYPQTIGRTRTIHFTVPLINVATLAEARAVADLYALPEQYFFMPNQLSKHKNHILVIEALSILRSRGVEVCIAASGKQLDERHPEHFPTVKRRLEESGLQNNLRLLGLIPYAHLPALMRASIALLNPSLFEGWSTSVEEARSLGVPLVLSDLEVHREQAGVDAVYFERESASSLADALKTFEPLAPRVAEARYAVAQRETEVRVERFAEQFATLAEDCISGRFRS